MRFYRLFFTAVTASILSVYGARSETYDQTQTGDYNVRLHLKDFQIIALLGSDALSSMNDNYEYDYEIPEEYLDVTSTTTKPTIKTTRRPTPQSTTKKVTRTTMADVVTTEKYVTDKFEALSLDKIPVVVMMQAHVDDSKPKTPAETVAATPTATSVAIVPEEDFGNVFAEHPVALGEILHYKRCSHGYTRDKRGRCRKIRRPQLPFDIARLASNWAARLKYSKDESTSQSGEH